ncbi:hypothetical protein [Duganella qianjiadongensis]|uniref:GNAT family N-acetyltransferase n=1 Tax=Duganella qianjiadongensis TaxID=2692176 RepID=A0ABW9VPC4_9BURK|nr:hypothetical protein [Duganella qianjiadongensis]MYM41419.1 hypothetical protein [Duganella qianjiadongensis]
MDATYQEWFAPETVEVCIQLANPENFLNEHEIIELTGAPRNSKIVVKQVENAIAFIVRNDIFDEAMYRYLVVEPGGTSMHLRNAVFVLKETYTHQGIGPRSVIKEIFCAHRLSDELPIKSIKVSAAGNFESFNWVKNPIRGYYVWSCLGFDGAIPTVVLKRLPSRYQSCKRISKLVETGAGRRLWQLFGESANLSFDLNPDSISWRLLSNYMNAKGIEL